MSYCFHFQIQLQCAEITIVIISHSGTRYFGAILKYDDRILQLHTAETNQLDKTGRA